MTYEDTVHMGNYIIDGLLRKGFKPTAISEMLNVPIDLVLSIEEDLMQLANPYSYGPDPE